MAASGSLEFGRFLGASSGGWAGLNALTCTNIIKDCLSPVSFPARVVVRKALYRFVGACQ